MFKKYSGVYDLGYTLIITPLTVYIMKLREVKEKERKKNWSSWISQSALVFFHPVIHTNDSVLMKVMALTTYRAKLERRQEVEMITFELNLLRQKKWHFVYLFSCFSVLFPPFSLIS